MDKAKAALNDIKAGLAGISDAGATAGNRTSDAFIKTESQFSKTRQGLQSISTVLQQTRNELIAFFSIGAGIALTKSLIETADAFTMMNARLKLSTQSNAEYATAQRDLFDISQRTASSLEGNITLYARIADSMRAMGKSQQDALVFTEIVDQALRISGASAESAKAGVTQLAQAMATGVLRGDEFNSVMENSPRLAKALADGLNVPIGKLRELAEEGKLTADKVIEALLSQADTLAAEYAKIPLTVSASLTQLSNAWTKYIGEADQAEGATKSLALAISDISKNFTEYANAVLTVGRDALVIMTGFGAVKLGAAVAEFAALVGATKASSAALTEKALASNQAVTAATALVAAEKAAAPQAVISAQAHRNAAMAAVAVAEATLLAAKNAAIYGPARAAAERTVTAARAGLATATAALVTAETANAAALAKSAAALAKSAAAAGAAAPAVTRLSLATGLLTKAMGPLLTAFIAFEALRAAGQWLGEFAAKLVVGDQEVKKFSSGAEAGMAVAQAATAKMRDETARLAAEIERTNALNAFEHTGESVKDAQARVRAAADGIIKAFDDVIAKSGDVPKAIEAAFSRAEIKTPAGIEALGIALDELESDGKATADQIAKGLQDGLNKLDMTGLHNVQIAMQASRLEGDDLARMMNGTLSAALNKIGTDALAVGSGLSKGFRDSSQAFDLLLENAEASSNAVRAAWDKMLDSAKTYHEAEALKAAFKGIEESGKFSAFEVDDAYSKLTAKLNELSGGIETALGDAFKRMGVKTAESVAAAREQMRIDFADITESGLASAESIQAAYDKMKSVVTAAVTAMTRDTREALEAAKQHTATVQAGTDAVKAQASAISAAATAQKAESEYARASAEAMRTGSEEARAKADALRAAADAAHAEADAAQASANSAQAAAEAVAAQEKAYQAAAIAARAPTEANIEAAAAAQDLANETAQAAESEKQAAMEAAALASSMRAAADESAAMADEARDTAKAMEEADNAMRRTRSMVGKSVSTLDAAAYANAVREAYDAAQRSVSGASDAIGRYIDNAGRGMDAIVAFGKQGVAAYDAAQASAAAYGAQLARQEALIKANEAATRSWASAMDSLRGIAAGLKDELDRALGNDRAIEERAYANRKRAIEEQYRAALEAAGPGGFFGRDEKAAQEAERVYRQALSDLNQLHGIKMRDIADAAQSKSAADEKNHQDELARISAEQAARTHADALIQRVKTASSGGVSGGAAAVAAATARTNASGPSVTNQVNIHVDGKDLLSEEAIRRAVAPTITKMMNGSR